MNMTGGVRMSATANAVIRIVSYLCVRAWCRVGV